MLSSKIDGGFVFSCLALSLLATEASFFKLADGSLVVVIVSLNKSSEPKISFSSGMATLGWWFSLLGFNLSVDTGNVSADGLGDVSERVEGGRDGCSGDWLGVLGGRRPGLGTLEVGELKRESEVSSTDF